MKRILTFADVNVLIAAARGKHAKEAAAINLLGDPNRDFCATVFLELETRPKAVWFPNQLEADFYEEFFSNVKIWLTIDSQVLKDALNLACTFGLGAGDALHAVAALQMKADEFVTLEKPSKPLARIPQLQGVHL